MGFLQVVVLVSLSAQPSQLEARALEANAEGNRLAAAGKVEEAIVSFKLAESLIPRFEHNCNIGQAYFVLKRWAQAWLFLDDCRARTPQGSPFSKLGKFLKEAESKLRAAKFVPVTVSSDDLVNVAFPQLSPDEPWRVAGERVFWLPSVSQTMTCESGARKWTQELTPAGKSFRLRVERPVVALAPVEVIPEPVKPEPVKVVETPVEPVTKVEVVKPPPPVVKPQPRSLAGPVVLMGGGAAVAGFGLAMFFVAKGSFAEGSLLEGPAFETVKRRYEVERVVTYTAFGVGGAMALAGLGWLLFGSSSSEAPVAVLPVLGPNGAGLTVTATF